MPTKAKRALRLKDSDEVLWFPDGSFDESVVIALLDECCRREIHPRRHILVTAKSRDWRWSEWGHDEAYKHTLGHSNRAELLGLWRTLPGTAEYDTYTPDNENQRSYWQGEMIRRRAEFPGAMGRFMLAESQRIKRMMGKSAYPT